MEGGEEEGRGVELVACKLIAARFGRRARRKFGSLLYLTFTRDRDWTGQV